MLNNQEFINLERRLWAEGNPLCDELVSTRDELQFLLSQAQLVIKKYSPMIAKLSDADDVEFFKEWDNFLDSVDNLTYDLGADSVQEKLSPFGANPLDKFPTIWSKTP